MGDEDDRNEADVIATFQCIEAHLRAKGHDVTLDDSNEQLHLACRGVIIDRAANAGISVTALNAHDLAAVIAALSDLEIAVPARNEILDDVRTRLVAIDTPDERERWWSGGLDCSGCDIPCDLADALDLGHCDVGGCDAPGCDL